MRCPQGWVHCSSGVCALCPRAVGQGATLGVCAVPEGFEPSCRAVPGVGRDCVCLRGCPRCGRFGYGTARTQGGARTHMHRGLNPAAHQMAYLSLLPTAPY